MTQPVPVPKKYQHTSNCVMGFFENHINALYWKFGLGLQYTVESQQEPAEI